MRLGRRYKELEVLPNSTDSGRSDSQSNVSTVIQERVLGKSSLPPIGIMSLRILTHENHTDDATLEGYQGKHRHMYPALGFVARTVIEWDPGYQELVVSKQPGSKHPPVATIQEVVTAVIDNRIVPLCRDGVPTAIDDCEGAFIDLLRIANEAQYRELSGFFNI